MHSLMDIGISVAAALIVLLVFTLWYDGWPRRPLTEPELDAYLARMGKGSNQLDTAQAERLRRFEALARNDDGREFFMLNLIRFRTGNEEAAVAAGKATQAHKDYMRVWGRVARPRASHAVYRGRPIVKLFGQPESIEWHAVGLMRYRSRRDFLEIVTDPRFRTGSSLKGASVEYTDVWPCTVVSVLGSARSLVFLCALVLSLAITFWAI